MRLWIVVLGMLAASIATAHAQPSRNTEPEEVQNARRLLIARGCREDVIDKLIAAAQDHAKRNSAPLNRRCACTSQAGSAGKAVLISSSVGHPACRSIS